MPEDNFQQEENDNPIARILALRRGILESPDSAEAHCDLGVAMIQTGDPKTAINYFKQAVKLDPNHERSYYNLGLCYHKIGFVDNAISAYESVIRLNPGDDQAWANLASLFFQRNEIGEAIEFYQKAVEINPKSAETLTALSTAQYLAGKYEESVNSARKCIDLDDSKHHHWLQLGQSYYALHDSAKAIRAFQKATELNNRCDKSWNNLANAYLLENEQTKAEEAYRKAIELDGNNTDYWFNLGELLFQTNSLLEASGCFSKVIESNPNDTEALEYLIKSQLETAPAEAAVQLNKLIQKKGEHSDYLKLLATAYQKSNKQELEAKTRMKLASSKPMDPENNYALAKSLSNQGKRDLAYSFFQNSRPLSDNDPDLWFAFAQSFRLENKLEEEFQCLTGAVKANPAHKQSWLRLGSLALQNETDATTLQYLEKSGSLLKNNSKLWSEISELYLAQGDSSQSFRCSTKLVNLVNLAPSLWLSIFRRYKRAKKMTEWVESLIGHLKTHDYSISVKIACADLIFRFGEQQHALTLLEGLRQKNISTSNINGKLAELYLKSDKVDDADRIITIALESEHDDYQLLVKQAEISLRQNELEKAEISARKALETRQDHFEVWLVLAVILHTKNRSDEALESVNKSLSLHNNYGETWFVKGIILDSMKQDYDAETAFLTCLKLDRRNSMAWLALAQLKLNQGNYNGARPLLLRAAVSNRNNQSAWQKLAEVYEHLQLPEKAEACRNHSSSHE